jgi:hypothetical protein
MPDEQPKPHPDPPPTGVWALGWKLLGLNAEQQRGGIALALTALLAWLVLDLMRDGRDQRHLDRANEVERTAMMVRAFESESEKGRQAVRDIAAAQAAGQKELVGLTVASHQKLAAELGKLEQRISDLTAINGKLTQQMNELNAALGELRKKLPPPESEVCPLPVRFRGPPSSPRP